MINNNRRSFILKSSAVTASAVLTACGGGGGSESGSASAVVAPATTSEVPTTTPVVVEATQLAAAVTTGAKTLPGAGFRLSGATSVKSAPFCLGYAFRKGDVPAGSTVTNSAGSLQVTPKNVWPDGSLKFAVLAGQADVTGGTDTVVSLLVIPATAEATPLKTAKLRATEIVAEIACGAYGTVTWSGADWDSPFQSWVAGPRMSSWIYRKPVGTDKHLVAWLEVRLWSSGAVEVLPWMENGYLLVGGPTNKSGTYAFSLGKTQRMSATMDFRHHTRTPLISGKELSFWLSIDPGVIARPDPVYLQLTELVPTYSATVPSNAVAVTSLVTSFVPFQRGNFIYDDDSMPSSGYQAPIGLLPTHDMLYLVADAPNIFAAVVRNGYAAGRYPLHYRDETTNRPLRFSAYPTLVISDSQGYKDNGSSTTGSVPPPGTGGNGPSWDIAHSPSVGFMAYLLTGRWYFMEQVQFAATTNYLGNGDNELLRTGSKGLMQPCIDAFQTRSTAWGMRTLAQALCVTPDADTVLQGEFANSMKANIDHFYGRYVAQPNNPFGFIQSGASGYDGTTATLPPWMQDFVTAAIGYSCCMGLPLPTAYQNKLTAFFDWTARSVVGRLSAADAGGFPYMNADVYVMSISKARLPDWVGGTGPWRSSWAEIYSVQAATLAGAHSPNDWLTTDKSVLAGEIMPGERAMWANLMPALSYAVRLNANGAQAAYDRLRTASNYAALAANFNVHPVWSVRPAGADQAPPVTLAPIVSQPLTNAPAWLAGKPVNQWVEIPGTAGAGGAAVFAYSGFALNHLKNEILIAAAGGHHDSSDNRVVSLPLMTDAPAWRQLAAPSTFAQADVAYYPDGKPSARHLYSTLHYIPQVNRLMLFGARFTFGSAFTFGAVAGFNLDTNTWDPVGTWGDMPTGHYGAVSVRATGEVYSHAMARWTPTSKTWTEPFTRTSDLTRWPIAHDSTRNQLFTLNWGDGEGYGAPAVFASKVALSGTTQVSVTFKPSAALTTFIADMPTYAGMDYDPVNDCFMFYCGQNGGAGRIYVVKPNSTSVWDMSILPLNGAILPPPTPDAGVHNRFRYVAALKGFVLMPSSTANVYFIRTA